MKPAMRLLIPLVAAVCPLAVSIVPASADLGPTPPGYEIEAKTLYCTAQDVPCIPFAQDTFTDVTAWNFHNVMSGTPDAIHIRCAREWLDSQGQSHAVSMNVDVAPPALVALSNGAFHAGQIVGNAWVKDATEDSTNATGSVTIGAFDRVTRDAVAVFGTQITNNTNQPNGPSDTLVSGGFQLVFNGPLYNDATGQIVNPNATMTCSTAHQPLPAFVFPGGANFESFFGLDTDGDAFS